MSSSEMLVLYISNLRNFCKFTVDMDDNYVFEAYSASKFARFSVYKDLIFEPLMFIIFRLNNLLVSINYNFESYANRFSNLTRGNASN